MNTTQPTFEDIVDEDDNYDDIEVDVLTDEEVIIAKNNALKLAGCTWPELQEQAKNGRFSSDTACSAWMVVSSLV